ncbi:MAG TPA: M17 family peptidase N-terminal domain-containing protein [bacterium]
MKIGALFHDVTRLEADLLVAPLWEDDRPPHGLAGRADWHLCGFLSRLILEGRLRGTAGETTLIAVQGRLPAPRLLLLGCGAGRSMDAAAGEAHAARAATVAADLKVSSVVMELPVRDTRAALGGLVARVGDLFAAALPPGDGEVQVLAGSEAECEVWRGALRDAFPRGTPVAPRRPLR